MRSTTKKNKFEKRLRKSVDELEAKVRSRSYPSIIEWSEEDQCFVARVPALKGCMSHGDTEPEAARNIADAAEGWVATALEMGKTLPDAPKGMSGKLLVRLPISLHEDVARRAEIDGVSINQWVVAAIARAEGSSIPK